MIKKPKRPTKINNQDNKQPQNIEQLIRRYDLDNTMIYDFLDELTVTLNETFDKLSTTLRETQIDVPVTLVDGFTFYDDKFKCIYNPLTKQCTLYFSIYGDIPKSISTRITTIPTGYRPAFDVTNVGFYGEAIYGLVSVATNGRVTISPRGNDASSASGQISWIVQQ